MKSLLIDTSTEYCIVGLAEEGALLAHAVFLHTNGLARVLLPEIQDLLQKSALSMKDIAEIVIGVGPGSYTGTRVGVATARALAFGLGIPLRGFCSLIAFLPACHGHFASVLAAKSGLFYLLQGTKSPASITAHYAALTTEADLCNALRTVDFITAKQREEIPFYSEAKKFVPFHPDPHNIVCALQTPPVFPFEKEPQLIYLHQ